MPKQEYQTSTKVHILVRGPIQTKTKSKKNASLMNNCKQIDVQQSMPMEQ